MRFCGEGFQRSPTGRERQNLSLSPLNIITEPQSQSAFVRHKKACSASILLAQFADWKSALHDIADGKKAGIPEEKCLLVRQDEVRLGHVQKVPNAFYASPVRVAALIGLFFFYPQAKDEANRQSAITCGMEILIRRPTLLDSQ